MVYHPSRQTQQPVQADGGADAAGHGYAHRPGLGDGPGQQPVKLLLGHAFHLPQFFAGTIVPLRRGKINGHSRTGTGFAMVRRSAATVHSTASTDTPASAAARRAAPNAGWVASLGEKDRIPAIWSTKHTAAS